MSDTLTPDLETYQRSVVTELDAVERSDDGRTITVRLVPWDDPREVVDGGRGQRYVESFARGGLRAPSGSIPVYVEREHDGPVVGVIQQLDERDDGLYGTIRVSRSSSGLDTLADIDEQILRYVSVDFYDAPVPRGTDRVVRSGAVLRRVAFTLEPQHDAPIVSVRSAPVTEPETEYTTQEEPTVETETQDVVDVDAQTDETEVSTRSLPSSTARRAPSVPGAAQSQRFETLGHFVRSVALGQVSDVELERYQRALTDVTTTNVAGLINEQWVSEVIDIGRTYAPTVEHWRRRPLPTEGMSMSQPIVGTRPNTQKQVTQKSEVGTGPVTITIKQWAIETYAGGNDVSLQALTRSTPDLLTELYRLYMRELAHDLNAAAVTSLNAAAAVGVSGNAAYEYVTAAAFDELVIDASGKFLTTIRRPADMIALSVDLWKALGKAKDSTGRPLYPSLNPMNTAGRFDAVGTEGTIQSVDWYVEPDLGVGIKGVIGVQDAFVTALGPVGTLTADVPSKIGRDVAVYQEAAFGAADPTGLIQIVNLV